MIELASNCREVFTGSNPHQISEHIKLHIGDHRIVTPKKSISNAYLRYSNFEGLAISKICYGNEVHVVAPQLCDNYQIQIITAGVCRLEHEGKEFTIKAQQLFLFNPSNDVNLYYSQDCEKVILRIPEGLISTAAVEHAAIIPKSGVCFDNRVLNITEYMPLIRLLTLICAEAEATEQTLTPNQIPCAPYKQLLAKIMLCIFPSNLVAKGEVELPKFFTRLLDYIECHIKDNITIGDLAKINNVSLRTIYNNFSYYKNISPLQYIKQRKLIHIREELQAMKSYRRKVTEVALDYGFFHLGRFSAEYKKSFSELPSETIRNTFFAVSGK